MHVKQFLRLTLLCVSTPLIHAPLTHAQLASAPLPQPGIVAGTVTDADAAAIPGASISVQGQTSPAPVLADGTGYFSLPGVPSATPVHIVVTCKGFADWVSPEITLTPGQQFDLTGVKLALATVTQTVTAVTAEKLAVEEVKEEESQRIFGVIPNFYVSYAENVVPLSSKLKFQLALRSATDPINFVAAAFLAGLNQASDTPSYVQGAKGYGQRLGEAYVDGFTDILIGGAILPSLLHQDPRYFYKGSGTKKARALHAIAAPFIARSDSGKNEFNYSSVGGDLASAAITNVLVPPYSRGAGFTFTNAAITTGARIVNTLAQEFLFHRITKEKPQPDVGLK